MKSVTTLLCCRAVLTLPLGACSYMNSNFEALSSWVSLLVGSDRKQLLYLGSGFRGMPIATRKAATHPSGAKIAIWSKSHFILLGRGRAGEKSSHHEGGPCPLALLSDFGLKYCTSESIHSRRFLPSIGLMNISTTNRIPFMLLSGERSNAKTVLSD